ncbi:MAG: hypothetical protein Q8T08_17565 [Ignavibacteria bacterium]|nr:hypothetical protein [Ignavibacteria bacterium]
MEEKTNELLIKSLKEQIKTASEALKELEKDKVPEHIKKHFEDEKNEKKQPF